MKEWTIEALTEMWIDRGYSKRAAKRAAEVDFAETHRRKSSIEQYQDMLDMTFM